MAEGFDTKLQFIINMHNSLRWLYRASGTPQGHFVNENTLLRLAAMMETEKVRGVRLKPEGQLSANAIPAEVSVRVLFLFRNFILHTDGCLALHGKRITDSQRNAYKRFCQHWNITSQEEGETLNLDASRVLIPLATGCRDYFLEFRHNSKRQPK